MLDRISLDQLRAFIAAADDGSFSAAARRFGRSQPAISEMIAALECQMGVTLFDRAGRYPLLTEAGRMLLADARGIVMGVDHMKARAHGMASGIEPELSVVVDVFFPMDRMTRVARVFRETFPQTPLRLYVEALGGVFQPLLDSRARIGIAGPLPDLPGALSSEALGDIRFMMVASAGHPLARFDGPIPKDELARHVQLVLTDRTDLSAGRERGIFSPATWRLADLYAKHHFLLGGLGWGGMPVHSIGADLEAGRLVELQMDGFPAGGSAMPMIVVYPTAEPPGPAGRWLIDRLKLCPGRHGANGPDAGRAPPEPVSPRP
ncbi:LysR family transcriptional regulator [Swaminathania salitolerans]|uniref:LysR family transcriptional regulator n=1 Tax=Swaminathania salitolerans TaxID=182838 RepID=A0A511BRR5_9PROT|nr:LysR family transcriptional regulator [Swaminathania salitolerans]GBQ14250.1 LysR family transcriptional regulator [Swaminathania salitolerans LMG 21291]GEL02965.1 LysR family transcriptional regulator [Swaminathania salitolerans]